MALRNQPYIPLYIQDFLTDEKLNLCSAATQGVYIKIMCVLHKQKEYGKLVLFKQNPKQENNICFDFASMLSFQLPFDRETILPALEELLATDVLQLNGNVLSQKRMVKDGLISEARSKAGKSGGGNPNLFKQKHKQKPENEIVIEDDNVYEKKEGGVGEGKKYSPFIESLFEPAKDLYFDFYKSKIGVTPEGYIDDDLKSLLIKITGSMKSFGSQIHKESVIDNLNSLFNNLSEFWLSKLNIKTINNNYDSIIAGIRTKSGASAQNSMQDIYARRDRERKANASGGQEH